ncbi:MAG TPA: nucleotidyltransferase domain-containing protein [Tangfeifania sp.]|nr:nucleotidyltransferase domain-containing protein [Tangfeifania sp.]
MNNTGLKSHTIQELTDIFSSYPEIKKVILYGSRAKGNYKEGSDIDLVLIAPKFTLTDLNKLENQLDDLLLPWKIDLALFHHIDNPDLVDHINRVGITIYKN